VIFRKYGEIEFNEDLIAGFLTALKDFSTEVTGGKGKMKSLDMGNYRVLLLFKEGILLSGALSKFDDDNVAYKALNEVLDAFVNEFKDVIPTWNGNLKIFKGFEKKIDRILKNGKIALKDIYVPILKKKLPKQIVEMGVITKEEFDFSSYLNGKDPAYTIAEKAGIPLEKVEKLIDKFEKLGLIKLKKLS